MQNKLLFLKRKLLGSKYKILIFKKELEKRLEEPIVLSDKLSGFENVYKIKLRSSGFRLAYEVKDEEIVVLVLKIGKRDKFYETLQNYL